MKTEFYYPSSDGISSIYATCYEPPGEKRAVLQIAHGMTEYFGRYEAFAQFLCDRGIVVVGNDHLGHGLSVSEGQKYGYFAKKNGNKCLIEDIHTLHNITKEKYPDIPYFVMGHSMGSFLMRQYLIVHPEDLAGAIIMGTGGQSEITLIVAKAMAGIIGITKGWDSTSSMMDKAAFGSYTKRYDNPRTSHDWLTNDEAVVDVYLQDPFCTFPFTMNGYYNMFKGIEFVQKRHHIKRMRRDLPVFLMSGRDDPVGHYGEDVAYLQGRLKKHKIPAEMVLYEGCRHEILNEFGKEYVMEDILNWLDNKTLDWRRK